MMTLSAAALLGGCLASAPMTATEWTVDWLRAGKVAVAAPVEPGATLARLVSVEVRAPFSARELAVLRGDGTIAFDAYNVFAAPPASLFRGPAIDALKASGLYKDVLSPASSGRAEESLELVVSELALDCRGGGRKASVKVKLTRLGQRGEYLGSSLGAAAVAAESDFSAAFSQAFVEAVGAAVRQGAK